MKSKMNKFANGDKSNKNLWFVNFGGYDPCSMQEKHEFGFVVASSKLAAKIQQNLDGFLDIKKA